MRILYTLYLYMYRCLNLFIAFLERVRVATERERRRLVALLTREYEGTFATQPSSFDVDWSDGYYAGGDNNSKSRSCQITSTMIPLYSRSKEVSFVTGLWPLDLECNPSVSVSGILREYVLLLVWIWNCIVHVTEWDYPPFGATTSNAIRVWLLRWAREERVGFDSFVILFCIVSLFLLFFFFSFSDSLLFVV